MPQEKLFTHILAPTDFSPHAMGAFAYAVGLARDFGADLTIVHAVESWADRVPGAESQHLTSEVAEQIRRQALSSLEEFDTAGVGEVRVETAAGPAWTIICETAVRGTMDLIVIGTHGTSAVEHALMGSTAERVLRHAPCPVFVVRSPEHKLVLPFLGG